MRLFWFSCSFPIVRQNQKPYEKIHEEDLNRRPAKVKLSILKTNTV